MAFSIRSCVLISLLCVSFLLCSSSVLSIQSGPSDEAILYDGYGIQWMQSYGSDVMTGARYQGPQPIGDADNDGFNELLIGGRDAALRIMQWDGTTYVEEEVIHPPGYPYLQSDAGGFAIGDVTNNGKNEIAVTWWSCIYRFSGWRYWMIGAYPHLFLEGAGSADIMIGDVTGDGRNEVVVTGGASTVAEVTVLRWNGLFLKKNW